jgi:hypothetical protein
MIETCSPLSMTRRHPDQFAKQCLSSFLSPFGQAEISLEIPSEVHQVDVYFILGRIAQTPCLFEAFRNPVQSDHLLDCQEKLNAVRHELARKAKSEKRRLRKQDRPWLWVISPSVSAQVLSGLEIRAKAKWSQGVYFLPKDQRIGVIALNQLPVTQATLWLRVFGRGDVQIAAIAELLALPPQHPFRAHALEQLANLRITIQARHNLDQDERGLVMTLSQAYQQWRVETLQEGRQEGRQEGKAELVLRQLSRRVGAINDTTRSQIEALPLPLLESLGEALLDFATATDLSTWLASHVAT